MWTNQNRNCANSDLCSTGQHPPARAFAAQASQLSPSYAMPEQQQLPQQLLTSINGCLSVVWVQTVPAAADLAAVV
jgi:hypothetical protein